MRGGQGQQKARDRNGRKKAIGSDEREKERDHHGRDMSIGQFMLLSQENFPVSLKENGKYQEQQLMCDDWGGIALSKG